MEPTIKLAIGGARGRMGQRTIALAGTDPRFEVTAKFDVEDSASEHPFDVLIDFSLPAGTMRFLTIVEQQQGERFEVPLNLHDAGSEVFEGTLKAPGPGSFHVWLAAPASGDAPAACDFRVEVADDELINRAADIRDLELAADLSGGRCLSLADVDELADALPSGDPVTVSRGRLIPIWNRWEVLLMFVGVLTAEWLLRKRGRLV